MNKHYPAQVKERMKDLEGKHLPELLDMYQFFVINEGYVDENGERPYKYSHQELNEFLREKYGWVDGLDKRVAYA